MANHLRCLQKKNSGRDALFVVDATIIVDQDAVNCLWQLGGGSDQDGGVLIKDHRFEIDGTVQLIPLQGAIRKF